MSLLPFILAGLLMLTIGFLAGRNQGEEGYNIYNRKLPKLGFIIAFSAGNVGAGFIIAGSSYAYQYGLGLIWFILGGIVGIIVFSYYSKWLKEKTKDLNLHTLPDYFRWRFGSSAGKLIAIMLLLLMVGDISVQLIAGSKLLSTLGIITYNAAIFTTVGVVSLYLIFSGFRAVVWTDFVLISAVVFLTIVLSVFSSKYFQLSSSELNIFSMPVSIIISFFAYGILALFSSAPEYQRVFAAGSSDIAKKGSLWGTLFVSLPAIGVFIIGIAARQLFPHIDPDTSFLRIIQTGGKAIALVGSLVLWAALMSQIDTITFASSQIVSKEIFKKPSKKFVRISIILMLLAGVILSIALPSLVKLVLFLISGYIVVSVPAFFQWFMEFKQKTVITSLIMGLGSVFLYAAFKGVNPSLVAVSFIVTLIALFASHFGLKLGTKRQR